MKVSISIECSPTEIRRLTGRPDLFPIYQVLALAAEGGLVRLVAERMLPPSASGEDLRAERRRRVGAR